MKTSVPQTGYSALVDLHLEVAGEVFALAQVGPGDIVFSEPTSLLPCEGIIVMRVAGDERRWRVTLPNGASTTEQPTQISRAECVGG